VHSEILADPTEDDWNEDSHERYAIGRG